MPDNLVIASSPPKVALIRPLIFLLLLAAIAVSVRLFHLQEYVDENRLRQFIAAYGMWGPVIYLLVWTLVPALFLPGLPITLAGGVLFGPFWGVVYTALGAPAGATLAFLVARYLARDWVAAKISGTRLHRLDAQVARHGWKIVAFTRLIPILPFFVLNYAFGLTRIGLGPYFLATFFGLLPWTIAFVYFSSYVLGLFRGKISLELIIGLVLVILVSLVPVAYKKIRGRKGEVLDL